MSLLLKIVICFGAFWGTTGTALAHFGMLIPSENRITQKRKSVDLTLSFSHPFDRIGMVLEKPAAFYAVLDGRKTDLLSTLTETAIMGKKGWRTTYQVRRPGVYHFIMEPFPYWEQAEDLFIIQYTKTIIGAYGSDTGWEAEIGLPVEIVPLLRPFGNYAGNSFVGRVVKDGQPLPGIPVEVEFYNRQGLRKAPSDYHVTQVIRTDDNGVFSFSCPWTGWWGFSALIEADYRLKNKDGEGKMVELGGVLWVYMD